LKTAIAGRLFLAALMLVKVLPALADESTPAESSPPDPTRGGWDAFLDPVRDAEGEYVVGAQKWIEDRSKVHVGLGLAKSFLWNTNEPGSGINTLHSLDPDHDSSNLDLLQLSFARPSQGWFIPGFGVKLDIGRIAKRIKSDWNGDGIVGRGQTFERSDLDAEEAYLTWAVPDDSPALKGLTVKGGKFVTPLGAEVIEPWLNYNYSRSFLFGYAIPFTHTGALATYPISDKLSVSAGPVLGWDEVASNNNGWTGLGNVTYALNEEVTLAANGIWGPSQSHTTGPKRGVADLVATIKPNDKLTLLLNYDWGHEDSAAPGSEAALWQGFAGVVNYAFTGRISVAVRGEWFEDHSGVRAIDYNFGVGFPQTLWETTITGKYLVTQHLSVLGEYRHDGTTKGHAFEDNAGTLAKGSQDIIGLAAEWVFN
jgi:hypothetical protein